MTQTGIDWDALNTEAIDILSKYLQVDTSNPPGRERLACDFLGELLTAEGIDYDLYDAGDARFSPRSVHQGRGQEEMHNS